MMTVRHSGCALFALNACSLARRRPNFGDLIVTNRKKSGRLTKRGRMLKRWPCWRTYCGRGQRARGGYMARTADESAGCARQVAAPGFNDAHVHFVMAEIIFRLCN